MLTAINAPMSIPAYPNYGAWKCDLELNGRFLSGTDARMSERRCERTTTPGRLLPDRDRRHATLTGPSTRCERYGSFQTGTARGCSGDDLLLSGSLLAHATGFV